ncbi:uncharacterized protein TNCV_3668951 [Trichonephila clavipes]|nr:uncharacterized protein TNCV_3668951 [Trichonephila clavipes]
MPLNGESSPQILNLLDSTKEFVRMLESLEYMVDQTLDTLVMHMILFKLDPNSRTWFERTCSTDVIPKLDDLLQFLATHARSISSSTPKRNVQRKETLVVSNAQSQFSSCTSEPSENSRVVDVTSCISDVNPDVQILLCTALIQACERKKANVRTSCLGASDTRLNGLAEIQFTSHLSSQNSFHASVYVINKIVGMIPHRDLDSSMRELFGDISLADPAFYKSGPIDVLLGVDLTLPLLKGQTLPLGTYKPFAIHSELGWIIGGKANSSEQNYFHVNHIQLVSDHLINKFWELDFVPYDEPLTSVEEACEVHFVKTHSRDESGRYTVRDNSCTTKLRVVFDASRTTFSGLSLNDLLIVGPGVQPEHFPILIQFRIFSVAICADIEKMFRQIKVHEKVVDSQRILWRDSPSGPIREYRLTTVTYEKTYCAVIYIRFKDASQPVVSRLLTSKTRVSSVKHQSLPRLELCSTLLLANLIQATLPTLTAPISETFAWSDPKISLAGLKSEPRRWQPFVANREAQIQELTLNVHWNFMSGLVNPADCGTRRIPSAKLEKGNLWINGPVSLRSSTFPIGEFEDNPQLQEHMSAESKRTPKLIMLNVVDTISSLSSFKNFRLGTS